MTDPLMRAVWHDMTNARMLPVRDDRGDAGRLDATAGEGQAMLVAALTAEADIT